MTNREFLTAVANGNITDEVRAAASAAITKMDERNAKRASKPSKTALENEPIKAKIATFMGEHPIALASEIAYGVGISTAKASALARQMVADGRLTVKDVKVKGKGTAKGYSLALTEDGEDA